jgi:hypothetical protein
MALLGALEEEASQHHRDATGAYGSRADDIPPAMRERYATLAAAWKAAHAVLQRPDTVSSKDKDAADYEAEKAAAVPMAALTPSEVTLAKVLDAYQGRNWLAVGDALYAACLIGNGKDEGGLSPIGQALLERARKEGVL